MLAYFLCTSLSANTPPIALIKGTSSGKQHSPRVMAILENTISIKSFIGTPLYHLVAPAAKLSVAPHPIVSTHPRCSDKPHDGNLDFPEQYVVALPQATIVGNPGNVITSDGYLVCDYVTSGNPLLDDHWKLHLKEGGLDVPSLTPQQHIDGTVVVLAGPEIFAFYHWMNDLLPRLEILKRSGIAWDKIYVSNYSMGWVQQGLAACGIPRDKIIVGTDKTVISADTVLIPSMPSLIPHSRPTWVCDFLRTHLLTNEPSKAPAQRKKIYIARKTFSARKNRRQVVNDKEVMDYLTTQGFEKVYLENYSLTQQAELFNSADIIVAAHGAALINLVHCDPTREVTLIEFYHPKHINQSHWHMTQQLNLERGFHFNHCCIITSTDGLHTRDQGFMNIAIPLTELKAILEKTA